MATRNTIKSTVGFDIYCIHCGKKNTAIDMWKSASHIFDATKGYVPICKDCLQEVYSNYIVYYKNKYKKKEEAIIDAFYCEKKALKRVCMTFDFYWSEKLFNSALNSTTKDSVLASYFRLFNLSHNRNLTFQNSADEEDAIREEEKQQLDKLTKSKTVINDSNNLIVEKNESKSDEIPKSKYIVLPETVKFFGTGFTKEDYEFLDKEYKDWIAREGCTTKTQEEIFKQICFTQLELLKASREGADTKDLKATFIKQLDAANLQPKQNDKDTLSETQTFGTLLDKWENTRPLPEIDEDLKDVDKIEKYVDVFFRGHLAKMMNIKNGFSNNYDDFIKQYTVTKPEYDDDENSAIFDTLFGNKDDE